MLKKYLRKVTGFFLVFTMVSALIQFVPDFTTAKASGSASDFLNFKYGLFVHYVYGGTAYDVTKNPDLSVPTSVNDLADNFDATQFADDAASFGVDYVVFTAWHANMNVLYPSTRMANWRSGVHASTRDVIRDLIDALDEKGIKLILYTHPADGHDFTYEDQVSTGWTDPTNDYETWNDFINDIYDEITERYGDDVAGYWFDSGFPVQVDRTRLRNTVLANNPNAILIANGDANECCDYGCKELNRPEYNLWFTEYPPASTDDVNTWYGYRRQNAVVTTVGGAWWANGGYQRYSAEHMLKYTVLSAGTSTEGGGVCWAASPYTGGTWETDVKETYEELGDYIAPIAESIKNTYASTSFITNEGTKLQDLSWGGVATRSTDNNYEYIHVLTPPQGSTLDLPVPADGKTFISASLLSNGSSVTLSQDESGVHLTLQSPDTWDTLDTVIKLTVDNNNVALGKTVTVNADVSGGEGSRAVDGDITTGWYDPTSPQWLVADLGQNHNVGKFRIYHNSGAGGDAGYNTCDYKIQYADSSSGPWTDIVTVTGNTEGITEHVITPVRSRYFRLYITDPSNNEDTASRIFEFQIITDNNLACGKTVTASSSMESSEWYRVNAVDNEKSTISASKGWSSSDNLNSNHTEWVCVDLGTSKNVNQVILYPRNDGSNTGYGFPIDFEIKASTDNTNWTTVESMTNYPKPDGVGQIFIFDDCNARYIKINGTSLRQNPNDGNYYRMQLAEIVIKGDNYASDATVTASSSMEASGWYKVNAVDGERSAAGEAKGWSSSDSLGENHTEWVKVDLGSIKNVGKATLYPRDDGANIGYGFPIDFTIKVSVNNSDWTTVMTETGYAKPDGTGQVFLFPSQAARYIEIEGTSLRQNPNDGNYYRMQLSEIEVSGGNYALEKTVTASSSLDSSEWYKANAVDGEKSTISTSRGWSSDDSLESNHTEWIQLNLESTNKISQVVLYPRDDGANTGYGFPIDFTIKTSENGVTWTTVALETGYAKPDGTAQVFSFNGIYARYIKIEGTSLRQNPNDGNYYRMQFAEIEVN